MTADANQTAAAASEARTVRVDLVRGKKAIRSVEVRYADGMLVQQALEKSGATKKFHRMDVQVARRNEDGQWLKMGVEYDATEGHVPPGSDYALYPGDRIIAVEDPATIISDMMNSFVPAKFTR